MTTLKRALTTVLISSALVGGSVVTAPEAEAAQTIRGSVQCASGAELAGMWISANSGGSGMATLTRSRGLLSHGTYSYRLPNGGKYSVAVGCGWKNKSWVDRTKVWKTTNLSLGYVTGSRNFLCYDVRATVPRALSNSMFEKCLLS